LFLVFIIAEKFCLVIGMNSSYSNPFTVRKLIHANSRGKVTKKESERKNERNLTEDGAKEINLRT
jgi:hypothetical protein